MEAIPTPLSANISTRSIEQMLQGIVRYDFAQLIVYVTNRTAFDHLCDQLRQVTLCEDATRAAINRVLSIQDNLDGPVRADCGMLMWAKTES